MRRARESLRRLYWIDASLQHGEQPTAARLAGELGVSRGTIYRDMARLRDGFKAPVIFDPSSGGFQYGRSFSPELPDLPFEDTLETARVLQRRGALEGSALAQLLRRLLEDAHTLLEPGEAPATPGARAIENGGAVGRRARQRLGERIGHAGPPTDEPVSVRLRFDHAAGPDLLDGGFLRRRDVQLLTDGGVEAEVTTRDPDALLLDLLQWAPHFEIASPAWIRRRLPVLLRALLRHWEPRRPRARRR
jgi:predicted DNA-binding transcriptional regulator YafY